jgi:hypothetical protein
MTVECHVVAAFVVAIVGVTVVLGRHLLAATLAGGSPMARTLARVAEVWQRGQVVIELVDARRVVCWGAPFPPKPGIPRRTRQVASGRPPATFTDLLEAYRRSAPPSGEPARPDSIGRRSPG